MDDGSLFRLSMPEGMETMHLASPHDNPSQYLGAIFDEDNHLRGQARWEPVSDDTENNDDDKSSPATAIAAAAIAVALVAGTAAYLANNKKFKEWWDKTIVNWWRDSVIHTADKVWSKITHQEENNYDNSQPIALITANSEETDVFSKEVDGAIEEANRTWTARKPRIVFSSSCTRQWTSPEIFVNFLRPTFKILLLTRSGKWSCVKPWRN